MTDRPLRFCLVTTFYPPYNFGGDGIAVQRLATALANHGHHVEVVHCVDAFNAGRTAGHVSSDTYTDHPGIIHHALRSRVGLLSTLLTQQTSHPVLKRPALKRILAHGAFDVVHFHNISLIGLTALGYSDALTLYTMHEHWLVCPMHVLWKFNREPCSSRQCLRCQLQGGRPPQLWRYTRLLEREIRRVDTFIAPSEFTRTKHRELGFPEDIPIAHIPNFLPHPLPIPAHDTSPHAKPYFLYVGRLERIKGVHVALAAFMRYRKADLLIAGTGSEEAELHAFAADQPHIRFLGHTPYEQLQGLMRHALAVVVPSVGYEVFPTTVLEANAQGTPVIGHRFGPLPEMLDGRGGMTYATEDELVEALERFRTDRDYRDALGRTGREEYLAKWTPERHLDQYLSHIAALHQENRSFVSHS